jgi:hypothetical protein
MFARLHVRDLVQRDELQQWMLPVPVRNDRHHHLLVARLLRNAVHGRAAGRRRRRDLPSIHRPSVVRGLARHRLSEPVRVAHAGRAAVPGALKMH